VVPIGSPFEFYRTKPVLDFNTAALDRFQLLMRQKIGTGTPDLRITAIVLSVGATIVTGNQRDFQRVPGFWIED
jgi:predicted nucleic acid-binding protein